MPVEWVTFDCYGTLVDWERGITDALAPHLPAGFDRQAIAARYIEIEKEVEAGEYLRYRDVLDRASRALLRERGTSLRDDEPSPVPASLASWPPFPEVPGALRALRERGYRLAILSNVDRDFLAASIERIGVAPDLAVTAEDAGSYKPARGHWRTFQERTGATPAVTVHVGASLYHDVLPASAMGFRTVFVSRRVTPLRGATPTRIIEDLAPLPDVVDELARD